MENSAEKSETKDAISILMEDHQDLKSGFKYYDQICNRVVKDKKELAEELCSLFMQHAIAEEEIFYPAVREAVKGSKDMINEAIVEHASAKDLVAQIQAMEPNDELYHAKVKVLGELIEHHIHEEEGEMFEKAKGASLNLVELGARIEARKQQLAGAKQ